VALTRKKITKVLEKLERKNSILEKEHFSESVYARFHGGVFMWVIRDDRDHEFDKMFHTFQIEQAIDCIVERVAITDEQLMLEI